MLKDPNRNMRNPVKPDKHALHHRAKALLILLALLLTCSFTTAHAQEFSVRGAVSGNWYGPDQSGHGVQIEVIDEHRAVVAWYVYDADGNLLWLFGTGDIDGDSIHVTLEMFSGGAFPPAFDPAMVQTEVWGEMTLTFQDCENGQMSWTPVMAGFSAGSMALVRLTAIDGHACGRDEDFESTVHFSMDAGPGQWTALFADYTVGALIEAEAEWTSLPAPLAHLDGWFMAGTNVSDDLAMFLKTSVGGLQADTEYHVEMDVEYATNVQQGCAGIGGSPGESVYVKLGAADEEPMSLDVSGNLELNIDKGNQASGGANAVVAGNMANRQTDCSGEGEWQLKTATTADTDFTARTDADGRLWLFCGTDSGFEGRSEIYVTAFTARMTPVQ
ncbi:hypothetical protein [Elongatibacter sediminis]|uniref:DOMON domain-containing protein n=1 Tax=Elongatibacter sediminis TaxID=3119006 RepID=A0AAW9RE57_9GAMM